MKKSRLIAQVGICLLVFTISLNASYSLLFELSIGDTEEENNLMAEASDIVTDQQGNIYVLDSKLKNIRVFSAEGKYLRHIGREGVGPGEFSDYMFLKMAICPKGELYVLDRKISRITRFSSEGQYLNLFRIPFNPIKTRELILDSRGNLIIPGQLANSDKLFHVFNGEGHLIRSFGNFLPLAKSADPSIFRGGNQLFRLRHVLFDRKTGDVLVLSMMEYKIWRYSGQSDLPKVYAEHQADYFIPYFIPEGMGHRIFPLKTLFSFQDIMLIGIWSNPEDQVPGKEEYILDIFFAGKHLETIKAPGLLYHVDSQGRLYFSEEERIARYRLVQE